MNGKGWLLLLVFLLGCTAAPPPDAPPEIRYGEDVCEQCQMIISDPRFAAAYVTAAGEQHRFDDIGDMLAHYQQTGDEVARFWVHDFNTEVWVDAKAAVFVINSDVTTPMGWGLVAFEDLGAAEAYTAANGGVITTFAQLLTTLDNGTLDPATFRHMHETTGMESGH